jgi:hypothetical protein
MVNSESPKQVLHLLEAVSTSFLGLSIPHLVDTLDERQAQAACEAPREVRDKRLMPF